AAENDRLAADAIRKRAEQYEKRRAENEGAGHQQSGVGRVDLQGLGEEEIGIKQAGVPDHGLAGGAAEQRDQGDPGVAPLAKGFRYRRARAASLRLHLAEG